jgi:hypothetical protein
MVLALFLSAAVCPTAFAQAAVEYGLGAGRAATMTAPIRNLGKQIGGVWDSLDKAAKSGDNQVTPSVQSSTASKRSSTTASARRKTPSNAASPSALTYEDARHIESGIAYDELVRRFGPPSMAITTGPGARTLSYAAREGTVSVDVENDKVVTVAGGALPSAAIAPQ